MLLWESAFQGLNDLYYCWKSVPSLVFYKCTARKKKYCSTVWDWSSTKRLSYILHWKQDQSCKCWFSYQGTIGLFLFIKWQNKSQRPIAIIKGDVVNFYVLNVGYALPQCPGSRSRRELWLSYSCFSTFSKQEAVCFDLYLEEYLYLYGDLIVQLLFKY